jgi:hypothetical protein
MQKDVQKVLLRLLREPKYQQGIESIFTLIDMAQNLPVPQDNHLRRVLLVTEELISNFSGKEPLENFKFYLGKLIEKSNGKEEIRDYLREVKQFMLMTKSEAQIQSDEFKTIYKHLANRGRVAMRDYKEEDDLKLFFKATNSMIRNMKNDDLLKIFRRPAGILQSDHSSIDNEEKVKIDIDMLSKIQKVILPVLVDAFNNVPVPRISSSTPSEDFSLDNIFLCSSNIIPENIHFQLKRTHELSLKNISVQPNSTYLVIQLNHILIELKDVEFYFKKKTFPLFEDKGRVTFRIKGQGAQLTITYTVEQNPEDNSPKLIQGYPNFDISHMDIKFDTSTIKHTVIIPMLTRLFKTQIKKQIEVKVEKILLRYIAKLGDMLSNILKQMNRPLTSGLTVEKKKVKSPKLSLYKKKRE